jgi:hypothetical protein
MGRTCSTHAEIIMDTKLQSENLKIKDNLGGPCVHGEIKVDRSKVGCEDADWIQMTQDIVQ